MARRRLTLWLLTGCVGCGSFAGSAACVAVPYASPPVRISVSSGVVNGAEPSRRHSDTVAGDSTRSGSVGLSTLRLGVHPLQIVMANLDRPFDFGVGYALDGTSDWERGGLEALRPLSGPYLEGSYWPAHWSLGGVDALRLGLVGQSDFLYTAREAGERDFGFGVSGGVTLEYSHYCGSPFVVEQESSNGGHRGRSSGGSNSTRLDVVGLALGEIGVGTNVQAGFRWVGGQRYWFTTIGLTMRLPASAGLFIYWL